MNLFGGTEGGRPLGRPSSARDVFRSIEQCVRARIWMSSTRLGSRYRVLVNTVMNSREGADTSLARPTSPCRRTESMVSLERGGLFMCRIASLFSLQKLKVSMLGDARDFNNMETRAVINLFSARQGAEGNSRHSDSNIGGIYTNVRHRQKLGGPI